MRLIHVFAILIGIVSIIQYILVLNFLAHQSVVDIFTILDGKIFGEQKDVFDIIEFFTVPCFFLILSIFSIRYIGWNKNKKLPALTPFYVASILVQTFSALLLYRERVIFDKLQPISPGIAIFVLNGLFSMLILFVNIANLSVRYSVRYWK